MQEKILVIEDDEILNSGLCYNLQKRDMVPFPVSCIEEAKAIMRGHTFDLILMDINLPDGSGFDFAKEAISQYTAPIVFLTAHNLDEEIVRGLQMGADDYIVKPFSIKVVMEKIQAILRRCSGLREMESYTCGNLVIDLKNHLVKRKGQRISLTPTEFEILEVLCKNRKQLLTKSFLLDKIWDVKGNFVNEHTLSLNVSRLRSKIADEEFEYIKTIYGLGYKWSEED